MAASTQDHTISTLADLGPNQVAHVVKVVTQDASFKKRLNSLGLVPGASVSLDKSAPLGDPRIYTLMGYSLGLRNAEARQIQVTINA